MRVKNKQWACPVLAITAPGSHHGKTLISAALARYHRNKGRDVRVFKVGPDFLDPMILQQASGQPVYQLDLWMNGVDDCARLLQRAAAQADLIIVEGVMGLFDGRPSTADLCEHFGLPVVMVVDARGMAQTFGVVVEGVLHHNSKLSTLGVVANHVSSRTHAACLIESLPADIPFLGRFSRNDALCLPSRHLGLVSASEVYALDELLDNAASQIGETQLVELPKSLMFTHSVSGNSQRLLDGVRIGVARDAAFSFIYQANLDWFSQMGAQLCTFSPLGDSDLPDVDSIWLPGGYPELHSKALSQNNAMKSALWSHFNDEKPIYAECGGLLYLLESLTNCDGERHAMVGTVKGSAVMQKRLSALGMQSVMLANGELRGHTFHYSQSEIKLDPQGYAKRQRDGGIGEAFYGVKRLFASYVHLYFPSNSHAAASLFSP